MGTQRKEIAYLTELRAISCIAIIVLHTFYAASASAPNMAEKITAITVRNLMMWAVPCFVMITGTLLLDQTRQVTYRKLFTKYIPRVLIALFVFSVFFALLDAAVAKDIGFSAIGTGLKNAVTGQSWKHMWYLYLSVALYLLIPIYRKVSQALTSKDSWYLIGIYTLFLSALPMLESITSVKTGFYICTYSVYPLYLFLGYAISQEKLSCPRWLWAAFAATGTIAIGILTILSEKQEWKTISSLLESYAFPLILMQSAGIFGCMFSQKRNTPKWLHTILQQVDQCSFGIYLFHMVLLKTVLVYLRWNPYTHGGTIMVLLLTLAVTVATFGCVWLLKRIPGLKQLL